MKKKLKNLGLGYDIPMNSPNGQREGHLSTVRQDCIHQRLLQDTHSQELSFGVQRFTRASVQRGLSERLPAPCACAARVHEPSPQSRRCAAPPARAVNGCPLDIRVGACVRACVCVRVRVCVGVGVGVGGGWWVVGVGGGGWWWF